MFLNNPYTLGQLMSLKSRVGKDDVNRILFMMPSLPFVSFCLILYHFFKKAYYTSSNAHIWILLYLNKWRNSIYPVFYCYDFCGKTSQRDAYWDMLGVINVLVVEGNTHMAKIHFLNLFEHADALWCIRSRLFLTIFANIYDRWRKCP